MRNCRNCRSIVLTGPVGPYCQKCALEYIKSINDTPIRCIVVPAAVAGPIWQGIFEIPCGYFRRVVPMNHPEMGDSNTGWYMTEYHPRKDVEAALRKAAWEDEMENTSAAVAEVLERNGYTLT